MIFWALLFLIIVIISALLAYRSMKDFQLKPIESGYGLFLIKNPLALVQVVNQLHTLLSEGNHLISLERLFKGSKSALVIFAPRAAVKSLNNLDLIEIEEYTAVDPTMATAWEVGSKDQVSFHLEKLALFSGMPSLQSSEQFWWQIILESKAGSLWPNLDHKKGQSYQLNLQKMIATEPILKAVAQAKNKQKIFHAQIRAVLVTSDRQRKESLTAQLTHLDGGKLVKVPRPYTSEQLLDLYKKRSKKASGSGSLVLTAEEVLQLCAVIK